MATNYAEAVDEALSAFNNTIKTAKLTEIHRDTLNIILPDNICYLAKSLKGEPEASSGALSLQRIFDVKGHITGSTGALDITPIDNIYPTVESRRQVDKAFDQLGVAIVRAHEMFKHRQQGMSRE